MKTGTDIYLYWEGKTEEDRQKQITGWNITCGDAGYLRASIGMASENACLRVIFPGDFWEHEDFDEKE